MWDLNEVNIFFIDYLLVMDVLFMSFVFVGNF